VFLKKIIKQILFLKKELKKELAVFRNIFIASELAVLVIVIFTPCWISQVLLFIILPFAVAFLFLLRDIYKAVK
jgi:hypothetical protein